MAEKEKNLEIRNLIKAALGSSIATLFLSISNILKGKLLAVFLGTTGMGIIAQLMIFRNLLVTFSLFGISVGVVKYLAEFNSEGNSLKVQSTIHSSTTIVLFFALLSILITSIFATKFSILILNDPIYKNLFLVIAIGIPFGALWQLYTSFFNGFKDVRGYTLTSILVGTFGVLVLIPFLYFGKLKGAVFYLPAVFGVNFIVVFLFFMTRYKHLFSFEKIRVFSDFHVMKLVLAVGIVSIIMASSDQAVLLFLGSDIIKSFGIAKNGIYQAVYGLSQQSMSMALGFIGIYAFPRVCELKKHDLINLETNRVVKLTLIFMTIIGALMILFRRYLILVFLSPDFLPAEGLFKYQMTGALFKSLSFAVSVPTLVVANKKVWLYFGLSAAVAFLLFFLMLKPIYGFEAIAIAYLLAGIFSFFNCYIVMNRYSRYKLSRSNTIALIYSICLFCVIIAISDNSTWSYIVGMILLVIWARLVISKEEIDSIKSIFSKQNSE